jgi:glucokinase
MNKKVGIGLDLGGSSIKFALATETGEILKTGYQASDANADKSEILENLYKSVCEMKSFARSNDLHVDVVGVGTPGNVDLKTGMLMGSTPNFKNWKDINISKELGQKCELPVFVDNDANLMALGEARFGTGIGFNNLICVTVGTGIGGGIIINGELYRGAFYAGGELGHTLVETNGIRCNCGGKGCLEMYASATAIIREFKKHAVEIGFKTDDKKIDVAYIYNLYHKNNKAARQAIDEAIHYLGRGLASVINLFNPHAIIIGGGVADAGDIYINEVRKTAFEYAMPMPKKNVRILGAKLGNQAGFLGAISFAFTQLKECSYK